jgi:(4-(4-[2-(gamma-L-glutamylamino)ethyl]phenoxymethyl)furan-2-yl)methanamine synthase
MSQHNDAARSAVIGWDIGGANIKAARLDGGGLRVAHESFPIWQRKDDLAAVMQSIADRLGPADRLGVTITAELSDAFRTKREGIGFVLDAVEHVYPDASPLIWGVDGRFHDVATARAQPLLVAAANWMATAVLVAQRVERGLLVDVGSTTTDIVPFADCRVLAEGRTDPERLMRGELLYTGAQRTTVCAIVQRVPLWDGWCSVASELFATAQDVHLLLGRLMPDQCDSPTADGRPASAAFAAERLARVVCADVEMIDRTAIDAIARHVADEQVDQISAALRQVIARSGVSGPVIAAGAGAFLATDAAERLGVEHVALADSLGAGASHAAPAAALALLLADAADV